MLSNTSGAELPADVTAVTSPRTITVGGIDVRVTGASAGDRHVIVGQRTDEVAATQETILTAELIIGPILLALVFLGAVAIGRRVAAPIHPAPHPQQELNAAAAPQLRRGALDIGAHARTPGSVIEAQTSLALAGVREPDADRQAFERIDRESRRIRRILEDLLWLARFDALRGAPDAEPVDVGVMASTTAERFAVVAEARGLRLAVDAAPGRHVVAIPPDWLDRLLGVLVDNACKFGPQGSAVRIVVGGEAGRVTLAVEDAGPGIPPEERTLVFDRFHRASSRGGGAGLGLAIADGIVRATHGRWRLGTSSLGGASLAVSWPRALPESSGGAAPTA